MSTVPYKKPINPSQWNDKPLPQNLDAERAILGAIILDNESLAGALKVVAARDFFLPAHRNIFAAMFDMGDAGMAIDTVTLMEKLKATNQLEPSGGVGYLSQLTDGLPRVTNVEHYAKIVAAKARLRQIIYAAQSTMDRALSDDANVKDITADLASSAKHLGNGHVPALVSVDFRDLMDMELPPRDHVIEPLLASREQGMIYSPRGAGKTYVTMQIAFDVASGAKNCFVWEIPKPRPVVYVDGEMSIEELQERQRHIARINDRDGRPWPEPGFLKMIARDLQKDMRPRINTRDGRQRIADCVDSGQLLILDNLASLGQSSDEKETEDWAAIQDWVNDLCWNGISVIMIHHAGKSGSQRGTSKREDLLSFVLNLRIPSDYSAEQGLRVEAILEKKRGKLRVPAFGQPFEIALVPATDGTLPQWAIRPLTKLLRERALQMLQAGMKPNDVAQDTGLNRYAIYRLREKMKTGSTSIDQD